MRTLLDELIPPQCLPEQNVSGAEKNERTFSEGAVLPSLNNFLEVGAEGAAMATPNESRAESANVAFARGLADSGTGDLPVERGNGAAGATKPNQTVPAS